jgi:hypothetical protein
MWEEFLTGISEITQILSQGKQEEGKQRLDRLIRFMRGNVGRVFNRDFADFAGFIVRGI